MPYIIRKSPNGKPLDILWFFADKEELVRSFGTSSTYTPVSDAIEATVHVFHPADPRLPFIAEWVDEDDRYEDGSW